MEPLLERDDDLAALQAAVRGAAVRDAARREGSVVLLTGEAGIGKSSLVAAWQAAPGTEARFLVGMCDDLQTSRTLGPLRDVARRTGGQVARAVADADTGALFDALLDELSDPLRPTVLVLEDVHWADEATLDVVRYVGRRIARLPAVVALTYRDDLPIDHPLPGVVAALSGPVHRIALQPLSGVAVARLTAGSDVDPEQVRQVTDGNPFFVTEVARDPDRLPASVTDAVHARVQVLPTGARQAVERLAVVPEVADHDLLAALAIAPDDLSVAEAAGLLSADATGVRFRHELARRAVATSLPVATRIVHHRAVLAHRRQQDDHVAVLHHAAAAGDGDAVTEHGPRAAHAAFRAGAHRQADEHQAQVLAHADRLAPPVRAGLFEERAVTLAALHRVVEARRAAEAAVAERRLLDDPVALARALIVLGRMHQLTGDARAAAPPVEEAVALLDTHGTEEERAEGLVARASTYALIEEPAALAVELTERAVEVTGHLDRPDLRSLALNYRAIARCAGGGKPDEQDFRDAVRLALDAGQLEVAARAYTNLAFEMMVSKEPSQRALPVLDEALAFLEDHDFVAHAFEIRARKATVAFSLGRWDEAEAQLVELRASTDQHGVIDLIALESLTRLRLRRGDPDAKHLLDSAWILARRSDAAPYLGLIGVIRVEQAWLEDRPEAVPLLLADIPVDRLRPRLRAEILRYAALAGIDVEVPGDLAEPWASALRGDWRAAAAAWREDQRPYELAVELAASGETDPMLEAVTLFNQLGAVPAATATRRRLRELGVRRIPRGPSPPTREHPAGLTPRQAEVLELLVEGLTNAQIAARLVVSVRTVDHHVAAVLQKLGVTSRREAAALDAGWR